LNRGPIVVVLASLVAGGCSSATDARALRESLGPNAIVLTVPRVEQRETGGCGLACLESLLAFHGLALDAEGRARFSSERLAREKIPAGELRAYLKARGFRAMLVHGTLDARAPAGLFHVLRVGVPSIVELAQGNAHHYALACGYDGDRSLVLLMDPDRGIVGVPYADFERVWANADHLLLVAVPPPRTP
jgi:ABC-type bacteriocin/lantibiotic exporter with double-glycine peptidase domain